jgi:hypothetical protein
MKPEAMKPRRAEWALLLFGISLFVAMALLAVYYTLGVNHL